ncbi:uncharacterized protein [Symphalangus syndactylus]|uniref:uncharacterized protein n=1 Tax=Symphalangus syndactylus TaxID=9590 RepID=UPI003007000D
MADAGVCLGASPELEPCWLLRRWAPHSQGGLLCQRWNNSAHLTAQGRLITFKGEELSFILPQNVGPLWAEMAVRRGGAGWDLQRPQASLGGVEQLWPESLVGLEVGLGDVAYPPPLLDEREILETKNREGTLEIKEVLQKGTCLLCSLVQEERAVGVETPAAAQVLVGSDDSAAELRGGQVSAAQQPTLLEHMGPAVKDSGAHIHLKGIRGGSVLLNVIERLRVDLGTKLEEVVWTLGKLSNHTQVLRVHRGAASPTWVGLEAKFKQRVHVPSVLSLRIENLAPEDSGQYMAMICLTGGQLSGQVFYLTVYEPVPHPEILTESLSIIPGSCNITVECRAPGATEDLNVTWESKGLLGELEHRETPGPAPNPWTLAVNLPLSQRNSNLTCVVSNQVDQKDVILPWGSLCQGLSFPQGQFYFERKIGKCRATRGRPGLWSGGKASTFVKQASPRCRVQNEIGALAEHLPGTSLGTHRASLTQRRHSLKWVLVHHCDKLTGSGKFSNLSLVTQVISGK